MTDIAIQWSGMSSDLIRNAGSLQGDDSLYSEVIVRLFTDRRAPAGAELPDESTDRRGVWSDSFDDEELGSHLWLLSRAKLTQQTAIRAREYAEQALASLIDQGKALTIVVSTELRPPFTLAMFILITLPDGSRFEPFPDWLDMEL